VILLFRKYSLIVMNLSNLGENEAAKLQKHLNLLRQEYVKLQNKTLDLEQKLALASATSGNVTEDTYASQLLQMSNDLYDKETYT